MDQTATVVVADAGRPGRLGEQVVDMQALRTLPAGGKTLHKVSRGNVDVDQYRFRKSALIEQAREESRLGDGPRVPIQQESPATVRLADPARDHPIYDLV